MKTPLRCILAFALALPALPCLVRAAAVSPPGVNLRWDKCYGDGGVQYRDFACDTNTGFELLVGSFELTADVPQVIGIECYLNVGTAAAMLPEWWEFKSAGSCRVAALSILPTPAPGSVACQDWSAGLVSNNIAKYELDGLNHSRIVLINATYESNLQNLVAGQEYHAFTLRMSHSNTVGAGACGGCQEPVVVYFSAIRIQQHPSGTGPTFWDGANYSGSQWVSWQQGYPINQHRGCMRIIPGSGLCFNPTVFFDVVPYSVTPTRGFTWGAVKSLYR